MNKIKDRIERTKIAVQLAVDGRSFEDAQKALLGNWSVQLDDLLDEVFEAIDDWTTMDNPQADENETRLSGVKHEQA